MTASNSLPTLGLAAHLEEIEQVPGLRDFLFDHDRDLEIRDLVVLGATDPDRWQAIAARARQTLGAHRGRVGIHGPYEGLMIDTPDPDIRAIVQARLQAGLLALAAMQGGRGGGHMVIHSPYTTWHSYNRGTFYDDCAGIQERTHACLAPLVRLAEAEGLMLVIENCEDKDPAERVALAASFNSPAVRVSLDTGHAHYAHGAMGAPPVDAFVRAAGAALAHVHLQDAEGWADRHWAIGRGTIRWHAVFQALRALPQMPRLMLEMADVRDAFASARWLAGEGLAQ
ncbi:MAG: TIM barrel protein [Rhodobacteraceae bacterium]|nr:TIM barrel protein [Paracoccaceae bacterium]